MRISIGSRNILVMNDECIYERVNMRLMPRNSMLQQWLRFILCIMVSIETFSMTLHRACVVGIMTSQKYCQCFLFFFLYKSKKMPQKYECMLLNP